MIQRKSKKKHTWYWTQLESLLHAPIKSLKSVKRDTACEKRMEAMKERWSEDQQGRKWFVIDENIYKVRERFKKKDCDECWRIIANSEMKILIIKVWFNSLTHLNVKRRLQQRIKNKDRVTYRWFVLLRMQQGKQKEWIQWPSSYERQIIKEYDLSAKRY